MQRFVRAVSEDLGAEVAAYTHAFTDGHHVVENGVHSDHARMRSFTELVQLGLPAAPLRYGVFDALRVEAPQQNTLFD